MRCQNFGSCKEGEWQKIIFASPDLRRPGTGADFKGEKRGEEEVFYFQAPPSPSSRMVHLHVQGEAKPGGLYG